MIEIFQVLIIGIKKRVLVFINLYIQNTLEMVFWISFLNKEFLYSMFERAMKGVDIGNIVRKFTKKIIFMKSVF